MGDVGDYWREHREYKRRKASAESLGMNMKQYSRWERKLRWEENEDNRKKYLARCTVQCDCGKWFLDAISHGLHSKSKGVADHKIYETKEPTPKPADDWDIEF